MEERFWIVECNTHCGKFFGLPKKEFHNVIIDLMKRKRQSTTEDGPNPMNVLWIVITTKGLEIKKANIDSYSTRPHWARAIMETPIQIEDLKELVVALIDHDSKVKLMSLDSYQYGWWLINTKHRWKIRATTRTTE